MSCELTPLWLAYGYKIAAGLTIFLVAAVKQQTELDRNLRRDPTWLQLWRSTGFVVTGAALTCSVIWLSAATLIVVFCTGTHNLAINALALYLRNHPTDGGSRMQQTAIGRYLASATRHTRADIADLDRGQRYTHKLLESILRNQEFKLDDPVVTPFRAKYGA